MNHIPTYEILSQFLPNELIDIIVFKYGGIPIKESITALVDFFTIYRITRNSRVNVKLVKEMIKPELRPFINKNLTHIHRYVKGTDGYKKVLMDNWVKHRFGEYNGVKNSSKFPQIKMLGFDKKPLTQYSKDEKYEKGERDCWWKFTKPNGYSNPKKMTKDDLKMYLNENGKGWKSTDSRKQLITYCMWF